MNILFQSNTPSLSNNFHIYISLSGHDTLAPYVPHYIIVLPNVKESVPIIVLWHCMLH